MREGLDRHEAIHAIGSVLAGIIFDVVSKKVDAGVDINARYGRELAELTAASWRAQAAGVPGVSAREVTRDRKDHPDFTHSTWSQTQTGHLNLQAFAL
jgi:hypothetical protein